MSTATHLASPAGTSAPGPLLGRLNVGRRERFVSASAGLALVAFALKRGGIPGAVGALAGGVLLYRGLSGHCPLHSALGRSTASRRELGMSRMERGASASVALDRGIRVDQRVVILRPQQEVYAFFRDLHNLPRVMSHVEKVVVSSSALSHWTVRGPAGVRLRWDAEIINERLGELIAWRSRDGADVRNAGSVRFAPAEGGGTEVRVQLRYDPPAGAVGAAVAKVLGESPDQQMKADLQRLKGELEYFATDAVDHVNAAPHER
ncbi:MAG: SRPBCC family protein [Deltaproteobacteria bacterium]|nr:SRPBCC family protein [Myxococcales bacterium]MDP3218121.1 SRPBCC family protein [Deltaproteobacteria bacterium]